MASGAPDGARRSKGKGIALPSGYTPAGGGSGTSRRPAPDATPPNPDLEDVTNSKLESLKAVVEALHARLEAQETANKELDNSNTKLVTNLEELRKPTSSEVSSTDDVEPTVGGQDGPGTCSRGVPRQPAYWQS